ncbi:conserved hypothetical protein [Roseibium sp. TrichSKD4]|uniref:hypothetical protein n=1 Tax=Roseibium sp. TrichSKD4 TaxID=744980 RepID=UPI0001E5635B|nr:hypothetical protein [Roseibium sp. TrichSKD4]EFO34566.1 conserved hypothetical protein [Roseibium sp. TrichSKD4]
MVLNRPLQNRVAPDAQIHAVKDRGTFMGNRGGRIHDPNTRQLLKRDWASKRWICCVTDFKNRQREVMGHSYTELFFLDEVTALTAGHRPCFECRRKDALAFQSAFQKAHILKTSPSADDMDTILHAERLNGKAKRLHTLRTDELPDGAMVLVDGAVYALRQGMLLAWSFGAYGIPKFTALPTTCEVLTPPSILKSLLNGYTPVWHPSAPNPTSRT